MKFLRLFGNTSQRDAVLASIDYKILQKTMGVPGVSILQGQGGGPVPPPVPPSPDPTVPFYIEDISGSTNTVQIKKNTKRAPTITIEKSTDGTTWESMGSTSTTAITVTIPTNGKLYLRCSATQWGGSSSMYNTINTTGNSNVGGNIMSLLYGSNFTGNETTFPSSLDYNYNFYRLFFGNTYLVDASNLLLPATTLTKYCYGGMFGNCSALTNAPELPATTLYSWCYYQMSHNCTSLTTTPTLPATTLIGGCYKQMFNGCTNLNYIQCLATDISASDCTTDWTNGVAATGTFIKDPSMESWETGANGIPSGWTVEDAA